MFLDEGIDEDLIKDTDPENERMKKALRKDKSYSNKILCPKIPNSIDEKYNIWGCL